MKKLFGIFSLSMLLFSSLAPSFTYANTEAEDEAVNILTEELNNTMAETSIINNQLNYGGNNSIELTQENESENSTAEFLTGINFIFKIKKLANNSIANGYTADTLITKIERTKTLIEGLNENNIVSSANSEKAIYAWFDNGTIYYYSEAKNIYLPKDSSYMFYNLNNLESIDLKEFNTSEVETIESMFYNVGLKNLDLSYMDFSKVTNINYLFQSCKKLEHVNFEKIDLRNVGHSDRGLFYGIDSLIDINLSGANFNKLDSMSYMFGYSHNVNYINLTNADFSNATNISYAFIDTKLDRIDLKNVKRGKVTNAQGLFLGVSNPITVDLSYANLGSLENITRSDNFIPQKVETINFEGTNLSNIKSMKYWFQSKNNLKNLNLSGTILTSLEDMSYMFQSNNSITGIDFTNTDLSNVKTMEEMFSSSYGIEYVDFSGSDLRNLENTNSMFNYTRNLTGVNFHGAILTGLTDVEEMFNEGNTKLCQLNVDFGEAILGTTLNSMFKYSKINYINFSGADFSNVVDAGKLFYYIPTLLKIDFTNIKGANKITNMESMFYSDTILTGIDLSNFDLSKVKNMYGMFQSCNNLKNINFGDSKIKPEGSLYSMFENNYYLTGIDLSNFDTSEVTNMSYMFASNHSLKELNLSNFDTRKVKNMDGMFNSTEMLNRIYVGENFKTNNVTTSGYMFNNTYNIKGGNGTEYDSNHTDGLYAVIDDENNSGYFTNILDKEYNIKYIIEPEYIIGGTSNTGIYTPRNGTELKRASKPGYELEFWHESGYNIPFEINESTRGDKTLYPKWKAIEEKAQETPTESVVYTNETTVTIGDDIQEEPINNSSTINLVSKEVETEEVKAEEEKITVQESEIKVTSDKKVEYEGGLEVYLEKTENEVTEKVEGTIKFSSPVAVKIPIYSNAETVKVQVKHEGEEFGYKGLTTNPVNNCSKGEAVNDKYNGENISVKDINGEKYALIYTCSASTFVAYTENTKPTNNTATVSSPAAGGGRAINSTKQENKQVEQEHNSANTEKAEVEETTTKKTDTQTIKEQVMKVQGRSLTRGEIAVMTNILLDVYPQLTENRELNEVSEACENYADEQNFTKDEKKAITRLCKLSIMGIHTDDNKPLDEFMVNEITKNDEFSKVINRSLSTYTEKDFSVVKDALKKLEGDEENVVFGTVYDVFMGIKNIFSK